MIHPIFFWLAQSNTLKFIAYFRCNNGVKWNHLLRLDTLLCGMALCFDDHTWKLNSFLFAWEIKSKISVLFLAFIARLSFVVVVVVVSNNLQYQHAIEIDKITVYFFDKFRFCVPLTFGMREKKGLSYPKKYILFIKWHKCNGSFSEDNNHLISFDLFFFLLLF